MRCRGHTDADLTDEDGLGMAGRSSHGDEQGLCFLPFFLACVWLLAAPRGREDEVSEAMDNEDSVSVSGD